MKVEEPDLCSGRHKNLEPDIKIVVNGGKQVRRPVEGVVEVTTRGIVLTE